MALNTFTKKEEKCQINNPIFTVVECLGTSVDLKEVSILNKLQQVQRYIGSHSGKNTV